MKVRDHCHFTGKYRGAAHNTCNLRYKIPKNIPVICHNGSTYQSRRELKTKTWDITYKIKFIDSFRFMATSLSKLVDNLTDIFIMINVLNVNLIFVL